MLVLNIDSNTTSYSLQADENLRSELELDVKDECEKLGPVDSVKVTGFD